MIVGRINAASLKLAETCQIWQLLQKLFFPPFPSRIYFFILLFLFVSDLFSLLYLTLLVNQDLFFLLFFLLYLLFLVKQDLHILSPARSDGWRQRWPHGRPRVLWWQELHWLHRFLFKLLPCCRGLVFCGDKNCTDCTDSFLNCFHVAEDLCTLVTRIALIAQIPF